MEGKRRLRNALSVIAVLSMVGAMLILASVAYASALASGPEGIDCSPVGAKFKDLDADGQNWESGEPGLSGWKIKIQMVSSPYTTYYATTWSNEYGSSYYGKWEFPSMPSYKTYNVSEVLQSGWTQTYPNTNGGVYQIYYKGGTNFQLLSTAPTGYNGSLNFGNASLGSIGDYVWHDEDRNGLQNEAVATHALANVDVRLWLKDPNTGALTYQGVRTTDGNGWYLFDNLPAGAYVVDCDQSDVPFGWTLTTHNDPMDVALGVGQHFLDADFGFAGIPNTEVGVGDWVWWDINLDGQQNDGGPGDVGLQCITVRLYNAANALIGEMNTDTFGLYTFQGLPPGTYTVRLDATDVDLEQVLNYTSATKPCHKVAEWVNAAAIEQPNDYVQITTPTSITYNVPSGYNPNYDFAAGTSPTAVTLQGFAAAPLPAMSVEVGLAAAGALLAGILAWRRRR